MINRFEVDIRRIYHGDGRDFYELRTRHGSIDAIYSDDRIYQVANFDVAADVRGNGHGQNLLRHSQAHAVRLGARVILSSLTSREAYEAAARVFGDGSFTIADVGDFAPAGADTNEASPTSALLYHVIGE